MMNKKIVNGDRDLESYRLGKLWLFIIQTKIINL